MRHIFILFDPNFWSHSSLIEKVVLLPILVFVILINLYMIYNQAISFFGWKKPPQLLPARTKRRFFAVIAAHNEEAVIAELLESLKAQVYPKDKLDVYVVADNCSDRTAEIAKGMGAVVYERFNTSQRGKTWAIKDLLEWISKDHGVDWSKEYYAISIFDADNYIHKDYFEEMNKHFETYPTAEAIQGYVDTKNPDDNSLTAVYALAYWSANPFWQWARYRLGLSAGLAGTGFVIRSDTLQRIGWHPKSLTEDLEFTTQLVLEGKRVDWCEWALVYDEKPLQKSVSYRQRTRWMQGHLWCLRTYGLRVLKEFLKTGKLRYFDMFLYLISPGKMMVNFLLVIGGYAWTAFYLGFLLIEHRGFSIYHILSIIWPLIAVYQTVNILITAPALYNRRHKGKTGLDAYTLRYFKSIFMFWLYLFMWMPIIIQAMLKVKEQGVWVKTPHHRTMAPRD